MGAVIILLCGSTGNIIRCPEQEQHFPYTYLDHLYFHCQSLSQLWSSNHPMGEATGGAHGHHGDTALSCPTSGFLMPMKRNKAHNMTCKYLCIPSSIGTILTMFVIQMSISTGATCGSEQDSTSHMAHMQNMLPHLGHELPHMLLEIIDLTNIQYSIHNTQH